MDATQKITDLISVMSRMAELLQAENLALREQRAEDVKALLDEKANVSRIYETRVKGLVEISERDESHDEVDPDLRERLIGLGQKTHKLMEENAMLLKVSIEANKRVIDAVAEAVKESRVAAGVYTARGAVDVGNTAAAARTTPISVNRSL